MKRKYLLVALAFMAIGFATISTTLLINGNTSIKANTNDFKVYYSNAKVNGVVDSSVITSDTKIVFSTEFNSIGQKYVLDYDVTNSSKNYDSALVMNCTGGNEYLSVTNVFDTDSNLEALHTRSGKLTLEMVKSYTGDDLPVTITCSINANAVERNTLGESGVDGTPCVGICSDQDGNGIVSTGDIITLGDSSTSEEQFYVTKTNSGETTMLGKYNLNVGYKVELIYDFLDSPSDFTATPYSNPSGLQDPTMLGYYDNIDVIEGVVTFAPTNVYEGSKAEDYINDYHNYLKNTLGYENVASIISVAELNELGCNFETRSCEKAPTWVVTSSYLTIDIGNHDNYNDYGIVKDFGYTWYDGTSFQDGFGLRPLITISNDYIK